MSGSDLLASPIPIENERAIEQLRTIYLKTPEMDLRKIAKDYGYSIMEFIEFASSQGWIEAKYQMINDLMRDSEAQMKLIAVDNRLEYMKSEMKVCQTLMNKAEKLIDAIVIDTDDDPFDGSDFNLDGENLPAKERRKKNDRRSSAIYQLESAGRLMMSVSTIMARSMNIKEAGTTVTVEAKDGGPPNETSLNSRGLGPRRATITVEQSEVTSERK